MGSDFRRKHGYRHVLIVNSKSSATDIVHAAVKKFTLHDKDFDPSLHYMLHYPDGSIVDKLPETDALFTLELYKQQLMKDYIKILFFIRVKGLLASVLCNEQILLNHYLLIWSMTIYN